jgi:hypothetical protein
MSEVLQYHPIPSAVRVHRSTARVKAICGPVGSGKTSVACWEFLMRAIDAPVALRGCVIRESYRELHDSTRQTFEEWFENLEGYYYKESDEMAQVALTGPNGVQYTHELFFRACRRERDASKLLSTEFGFVWLEEVVPAFSARGVMGQGLPRGVFDVAQMRMRQKGVKRLTLLVTFNPPSPRHWTYKEFFQTTPADMQRKSYALFRQPPRENAQNLPQGYYELLEETLPPDLARRMINGEVVTTYEGERVFPECRDGWHVVDHVEPLPNLPLICGQDYGLTPVMLITQITPGGQWRWLREIQLWNAGIRRFVEFAVPIIKNEFPGYKVQTVWQDPQGGNQRSQVDETTCAEILRAAGFTVRDGNNNFTLRKELIKQRLEMAPNGEPGVLISRYGCPIASEGMLGGYRYPKTADGLVGSLPIKNEFSHVCDCAQMIATGEFEVLGGMTRLDATEWAAAKRPAWNPLASHRRRGGQTLSWMAR